jgi:DNA-binding NarL/FixJ family response regulator
MNDSVGGYRRIVSSILLVADSEDMRARMRGVLESASCLEVCGEASDAEESIRKVREMRPDLIVFDLNIPRALGLETARALTKEFPQIPILMVSRERSRQMYDEARKAGVRGYMLSSEMFWSFVLAVRAVLAGGSYFSPDEFFHS